LPHPRQPAQRVTVRFAARPVCLVHRDDPLWLVVVRLDKRARRRGGSEPWRLLTTEPVTTAAQCWRIVEAYWARWQIENRQPYHPRTTPGMLSGAWLGVLSLHRRTGAGGSGRQLGTPPVVRLLTQGAPMALA